MAAGRRTDRQRVQSLPPRRRARKSGPDPSRRRCLATDKIRYRDQLDAERELAAAILSANPYRAEQRAYECPECGGWHLTSKPERAA